MISSVVTALGIAVHIGAVLSLLLYDRRHPSATLAWVLMVMLIPFAGLGLFFMFGRPVSRRVASRYTDIVSRVRAATESVAVHSKISGRPRPIDERTKSMLALTEKLAKMPASHGNATQILVDGLATYTAMEEAIRTATDHVHVEFYIIRSDETGQRLRDLLVDRANAGVEVRLVCDAVGSSALPGDFWQPLIDVGGQVAWFRPIAGILTRLPFRDRLDFRNHRKLVIVDGRIGFTGGINVGREYLGLDPERGDWRDTHVQIEGPAVLALQKVFAEDWLDAADELLADEQYYPSPKPSGEDQVQIVDSGPDREWSAIENAFAHAFALARERLWITSPYFVPSTTIETMIISAALRGVDVRVLVPARPDSRLVRLAAWTYFSGLLDAGVRIFRHQRGFMHAKTFVVDDWVATVGSANMDMRSFHLNYELTAFLFCAKACERLAEQFENDLEHAEELTELKSGLLQRLGHSVARIFSPIL